MILPLIIMFVFTRFSESKQNESKQSESKSHPHHNSLLNKLSTTVLNEDVAHRVVIESIGDYNSEKRDRCVLEKNIRTVVQSTGSTGKNLAMVSELAESSVHIVVDQTAPVITKIYETTSTINADDISNAYASTYEKIWNMWSNKE